MSRKLSKMERKLQRKAMLARINRGEGPTEPKADSYDEALALVERQKQEEQTEQEVTPEVKAVAPAILPVTRETPVQKRIQRVLETHAAELEQAEIEVLDELLDAAREGVALYKAEARARKEAQQRGEPINTRWQVAPGVFEKLTGRVLRIVEIKLRHRREARVRQGVALAG